MPSNKVQIAIVVGLAVVLAGLDWIIYNSLHAAIVVAVGLAGGLVVRWVRLRKARRESHRA